MGGSGFIGTHLRKQLETLNIDFEIIDLKVSNDYPKKTIVADIRKLKTLRQSINGDVIIHLAAVHSDDIKEKSLSKPMLMEQVIYLKYAKKNIQSVIFTSKAEDMDLLDPTQTRHLKQSHLTIMENQKLEAEKLLTNWYEKNSFTKNNHHQTDRSFWRK